MNDVNLIVKKIAWYSLLTLIMVVIIGGIILFKGNTQNPISLGGQAGATVIDVVGTRIGTSTTAVQFVSNSATSTYITKIGNETDSVNYKVYIKTASTTVQGPNVRFSILASNDSSCDTATTSSATLNAVVMSNINWYDAGTHLLNLAGSAAMTAATTTYAWAPQSAGTGRNIVLTELNARCLALQTSASGTAIYIQMQKKIK